MLPEQKNVGDKRFSRFERIDCGNGVAISVQGNSTSYCAPRVTLDSLNDYTELEMACFVSGRWAVPAEFVELFEEGQFPVAGYVPHATVCEIVKLAKEEKLNFELRES